MLVSIGFVFCSLILIGIYSKNIFNLFWQRSSSYKHTTYKKRRKMHLSKNLLDDLNIFIVFGPADAVLFYKAEEKMLKVKTWFDSNFRQTVGKELNI